MEKHINSRYYRPNLEEFHIGFEYEMLYPDGQYHKQIFGDNIEHSQLLEFKDDLMKIAHAINRVKYLDKQDIMDLGWTKDGSRFILKKNDMIHLCNLIQHFKEGETYFTYFQPYVNVDDNTIGYNSIGFLIKNKSELKRFMKQLGLEETYITSIDPYVQDEISEGSSLGTIYVYKKSTNITNGENYESDSRNDGQS